MSTKELKQLRKAAFAIGFGFTMGKFAANVTAKCMDKAYNAVMRKAIKYYADNGNKRMQELCEEYGINYEDRNKKKTTDKVIIGFHS